MIGLVVLLVCQFICLFLVICGAVVVTKRARRREEELLARNRVLATIINDLERRGLLRP